LQTELKEARTGLGLAKKPDQARIRLAYADYEFSLTLSAATFEFRNIRLPKTVDANDEGNSAASVEGRILERIALFEQLAQLMDDLFRMFINIRASRRWEAELGQIREWIHADVRR
jgi:recombination associated protein RdgC